MATKTRKPISVTIPLIAMKNIRRATNRRNVVIEVPLVLLKSLNDAATLDEIAIEAHLEYISGKTKSFTSAKELINDLRS